MNPNSVMLNKTEDDGQADDRDDTIDNACLKYRNIFLIVGIVQIDTI